ncbi:RNA polymerase sigma factor for flagellar operon FliA [Desulfonauticus submarinus]|uniref:RNA polymerase sigma factor for flagellar operon FliA n=1 Tax=Desulfonauticus submarinus TaxID=206665 RepID=A0A1H0B6F3_9BACT|nr:FliA/WhiG family RNA polymerase sigma factor [Desulfonauticus submarinus]SDN41132.1 RNA polymerase sigma factor for flagellar operon FliA [Desulfonauticus submarinus]
METLNFSGRNSFFRMNNPWKILEQSGNKFSSLSPREQEEIVKCYSPKIKIIALRLKSKLPNHITLEELISAGTLGLLEALHNFDANQNIKFETFAENRIRGAMLDELRKMDWFSRGMRHKMKQVEEVLQKVESLPQNDIRKYIQNKTGFESQEIENILLALQNQIWLSLEEIQNAISIEHNTTYQPQEKIIKQDLIDKVAKLIKELTNKEQMVLSLYYVDELTMKEIAQVLNITEGRVSQLRSQALQKLKKKFKRKYKEEAI